MKFIKKTRSFVAEELRANKRSILRIARRTRQLMVTLRYIFSKPENVIYGLLSGGVSISVAVWLANVPILQQLFESQSLQTTDRFSFLFGMISATLRNIDALQIWLAVIFGLFSIICGAFWLEALKLQHDNKHYREKFAGLLIATLIAGAVGIIGLSLVTPVITREGLSVLVSQHFSGTIVLGLAIVLQVTIALLFFARMYPIADRSQTVT